MTGLVGALASAWADGVAKVDRYLAPNPVASTSPLAAVFTLRLPPEVRTIGAAMSYLLAFSGYQLVPTTQQSDALQHVLASSLAVTQRDWIGVSLQTALTQLAAPALTPVIDPIHRTINFDVPRSVTTK